MSEVYDCTNPEGLAAGIEAAAAAVRAGGVVVLPTDTVYGIGCDAFDAAAVASVLAAKGRGREMPPPVLVPSQRTVDGLARGIPDYVRHLIDAFWPGALTLVLECQPSLTWDLGETNGTVALRMPAHPIALALLGDAGPMAVTSANITGSPAASTMVEAQAMLGESVAVYLDGGPATSSVASTILDCTGPTPVTLREGALGRREIDEAIEAVEREERQRRSASDAPAPSTTQQPPRARAGPRIAGARRRR